MTQEEKQLLLRDLCARLPYGVIVEIISYGQEILEPWFGKLSCKDLDCFIHDVAYKSVKPYLRPMSSMTEEEKEIYQDYQDAFYTGSGDINYFDNFMSIDYLNCKHFDYRGLIPMGLALPAKEGMY